jgi:thioester reductase-like protein
MTLLIEEKLGIKIRFAKFLANPTINALLHGATKTEAPWEKELELIEKMPPFAETKTNTGREQKGVLLTGATGHLGVHLLKALLEQKELQIHLLVRDSSVADAKARLSRRFNEVFNLELDCSRIAIYSAELASPTLGFDAKDFKDLCNNISVIIHAAAEVNHVLDYDSLKVNNILVSYNMLHLANMAKCEHVFYISTQFSEINKLPETYLEASNISQFVSGYEQSKFIAECLMKKATELGYPITTLRLPLLIDAQDPKLYRHNHFVAFVLKSVQMGHYPDAFSTVDILPTAQIARFIAESCVTTPEQPSLYNCLNHSISVSELFALLDGDGDGDELSGAKTTKLAYESWRSLLISNTDPNDPFYKLLPLYTTLSISKEEREVHNSLYLKEMNILADEYLHRGHTGLIAGLLQGLLMNVYPLKDIATVLS